MSISRRYQSAAQKQLAERERELRIRMENPDATPSVAATTPVDPEDKAVAPQVTSKRRGGKKTKV